MMKVTNLSRETAEGGPGSRGRGKSLWIISGLFMALFLFSAYQQRLAFEPMVLALPSNHMAASDASKDNSVPTPPARGPILQDVARMVKYVNTYNYSTPVTSISSPASECGNSPDFEEFFKLSVKQRSHFNEDKIVYETLFKNKMNGADTGTYVELGAFEGRAESNSAFFDLCLGWKGLLIEGNPVQYAKLLQNRPHAHKMSFAPSCDAHF
jgi:hypothetical protein